MTGEIQFALYNMPDDSGKVQVVIREETIWCTQKAMAQLFGVGVPAISKHLKNIFEDGELSKDVVVSKMEITTQHGAINDKYQIHDVDFYSLDAIIAVGYRVNSLKATRFRQWATKILNEYIRKGFAMDDERLKQGTAIFGKDYFRELLERVRSIRSPGIALQVKSHNSSKSEKSRIYDFALSCHVILPEAESHSEQPVETFCRI